MISVASGCRCDVCQDLDASVYDTHTRRFLCHGCNGSQQPLRQVEEAHIVPQYSRRAEYQKKVARTAAERQALYDAKLLRNAEKKRQKYAAEKLAAKQQAAAEAAEKKQAKHDAFFDRLFGQTKGARP